MNTTTPTLTVGPPHDWGSQHLCSGKFNLEDQPLGYSGRCFDFGCAPDRSEAAAGRHLNANAVAEDSCPGDVIQRQNVTTPNRATVPTVARVPDTWADIREVRANAFARDDFFDRNSAHFRA